MTTHNALSAIEQAELQDEVEALRQRAAELSALNEELTSVLRNIAYEGPDANAQTLMGWALDMVDQVPFRTSLTTDKHLYKLMDDRRLEKLTDDNWGA